MSKSNCVIYAVRSWWRSLRAGQETYLVIRLSRIRWGILHMLHGQLDHHTGQIAVTSFKPVEAEKTQMSLTFLGRPVEGKAP